MENCEFLIGNSSSGILEAPSLKIPVVNLGRRQADRVSALNVRHCGFEKYEIQEAMKWAIDPQTKNAVKEVVNPYGDGNASARILLALKETDTSMKFLVKSIAY